MLRPQQSRISALPAVVKVLPEEEGRGGPLGPSRGSRMDAGLRWAWERTLGMEEPMTR
jgi:hypothetical protein